MNTTKISEPEAVVLCAYVQRHSFDTLVSKLKFCRKWLRIEIISTWSWKSFQEELCPGWAIVLVFSDAMVSYILPPIRDVDVLNF